MRNNRELKANNGGGALCGAFLGPDLAATRTGTRLNGRFVLKHTCALTAVRPKKRSRNILTG
jgi:hypothetical protein